MSNHENIRYINNKTEPEEPSLGKIVTSASPHHRHGGTSNSETPRRISRQNMGSDRSIDNSPLHPQQQASSKASVRSWDRKNSSEVNHGLAPSTPGRSRLSSVAKGNDTPDDIPPVPKFGEWDDNDPKSAEGFSQIFQLVRDEKNNGTGKVPNSSNEASYRNRHKQYGKENSKACGCFTWFRK